MDGEKGLFGELDHQLRKSLLSFFFFAQTVLFIYLLHTGEVWPPGGQGGRASAAGWCPYGKDNQ
jgi:hypothetical protein